MLSAFGFLLFSIVTFVAAGAALSAWRRRLGLPVNGRVFDRALLCANALTAAGFALASFSGWWGPWWATFLGGLCGAMVWAGLAFLAGVRIRHASGEHGLGRQSRWAHPWVHVCAFDPDCRAKIRGADDPEHVYIRPLRIYFDFGTNGVRAWGEA